MRLHQGRVLYCHIVPDTVLHCSEESWCQTFPLGGPGFGLSVVNTCSLVTEQEGRLTLRQFARGR